MKVLLDSFANAKSRSKLWLIPVFEQRVAAVTKRFGLDPKQVRAWGFRGSLDQTQALSKERPAGQVLLVGMGKPADLSAERVRRASG